MAMKRGRRHCFGRGLMVFVGGVDARMDDWLIACQPPLVVECPPEKLWGLSLDYEKKKPMLTGSS